MARSSLQSPLLKHRRLGEIKLSGGALTGNARIGGVSLGDFTLGDVLSHRGFLLQRQVSRHLPHWAVNLGRE